MDSCAVCPGEMSFGPEAISLVLRIADQATRFGQSGDEAQARRLAQSEATANF